MPEPHRPDHYEPLPGIARLPRWLWAKTGRRTRAGVALALLVALAAAIPLALSIDQSKERRAESERRARLEQRAERIRELRAEQRPRFGRSDSVAPAAAPRGERLAARAGLLDELSAAVLADARRRVRRGTLDGPIRSVRCEPFPRTVDGLGAEQQLGRRRGRYFCLAVTAEFGRGQESARGALGHPYRALVDFESGRYGYCKISGRPDPTPNPAVSTPRACGG